MNPKYIDHIGIAVKSLEEMVNLYREVLGMEYAGEEIVEEQKVKTAFFKIGETHIELLEPTSDDSPVAKFIEKKGTGIHHIAVHVENVEKALNLFREKGVKLIDEKPRRGAHNKKIAFVHPKSTGGILLEICEDAE